MDPCNAPPRRGTAPGPSPADPDSHLSQGGTSPNLSVLTKNSSTCGSRQKGCIRVGFYDINKTIGKGNFATVKLARHRITKSEVALKIIDKSQLDDCNLTKTYREIRILKSLSHINIVRLYQVMETKKMILLVTEHASNGELFEYLAENGRLEEPEAKRIFWQIVLAVEYCHQQGVVHRDLKVENLLFDAYWDIKIADFGFSNTYCKDRLLDTWCGSPPYAAPEIFEGLNYNGEKLDIWSMGVILYVLVCGCLPFDGDSLQCLRERVLSGRYRVPYFLSSECECLIAKILVIEPEKRYSVDQIKNHGWMRRDSDEDVYNGSSNVCRGEQPLDESVIQTMMKLGIDREKTLASLSESKYDNVYAMYYLLLDKVANIGPIPMKSCSPKGSIGTPSIDEGFSSDISFDAELSGGKESSMELQMSPIKEDPEREHCPRSVSTDSQVSLDFDNSWHAHNFSMLKLPISPCMSHISEVSAANTHFHTSYDEVSGEKMLINLTGHSNFSSLESQCSEYSSNISLEMGNAANQNRDCSISPQVSIARPPLVHQQRVGDHYQTTLLNCGRRASESNLNEQGDPDCKSHIKHQTKPYDLKTLCHLESAGAAELSPRTCIPGNLQVEVAAVSSAPGSPQIIKRLTKQRHVSCKDVPPHKPMHISPIASSYRLSHQQQQQPQTQPRLAPEFSSQMNKLLPKPRSFDEAVQSGAGRSWTVGSRESCLDVIVTAADLPRQHSFEGVTRLLYRQNSTEEQCSDDSCYTSPRDCSLKARGRRAANLHMDSSPYRCKPCQMPPGGSSSSRRPALKRQETMRQHHPMERQLSKCSNSPPRSASVGSSQSIASDTSPSRMTELSDCCSTNDFPYMMHKLQQMELQGTATPQRSNTIGASFPVTQPAHYPLSHHHGGHRPRQISAPIPCISVESSEGEFCYLEDPDAVSIMPSGLTICPIPQASIQLCQPIRPLSTSFEAIATPVATAPTGMVSPGGMRHAAAPIWATSMAPALPQHQPQPSGADIARPPDQGSRSEQEVARKDSCGSTGVPMEQS